MLKIFSYCVLAPKKFGKPNAIYLDQHATYKVNNPWDQWDKEYRTQYSEDFLI